MGPLVPDVISSQMNLIVALLLGIAFGFVLEQAGFSSSRKLTGLFYGTDFTVLRVFFTAGVTAMSGVLILGHFGWLDTDLIYVNPTFLHSAILGGVIMGVGFVVGGYCPGTSFCGAAVGRIDGMAFVAGGALGVFGFAEMYPHVQGFYKAGSLGELMVYTPLGLSAGQFAFLLIAVALAAFVMVGRIERKVNPESPVPAFPARWHRAGAVVLLALGLTLAAAPDRKTRLLAKASDPAFQREHAVRLVSPDEAAFAILDRNPAWLFVDVRSPVEFAKASLPGAVNVPLETLGGKQARLTLGGPAVRKVFVAADQAEGARAAAYAQLLGYSNAAVLEGGWKGFQQDYLSAAPSASSMPDALAFRAGAGAQIASLIRERGAPKPVKVLKRVQGGCGS